MPNPEVEIRFKNLTVVGKQVCCVAGHVPACASAVPALLASLTAAAAATRACRHV